MDSDKSDKTLPESSRVESSQEQAVAKATNVASATEQVGTWKNCLINNSCFVVNGSLCFHLSKYFCCVLAGIFVCPSFT